MQNTESNPLVTESIYNAPVSKVWSAITELDQMKQWYFDIKEFKPEIGFEFGFAGNGSKGELYVHKCKITEVEAEKKLTYTWSYEGYPGMSYVAFELFPEGDKTKLVLTHRGLESFANNGPDFAKESFQMGWSEIAGKMLKAFVEKE